VVIVTTAHQNASGMLWKCVRDTVEVGVGGVGLGEVDGAGEEHDADQ